MTMDQEGTPYPPDGSSRNENRWAILQGVYYAFGGLWPLLSLSSFEDVTGNKRDEWLVRAVAGILLVVSVVLWRGALRRQVDASLRLVAAGVGLVLGLVGIGSGMSGRISWLYVPDGLIHLGFAFGWLMLALGVGRDRRPQHTAKG
ncbi:MAG: hypothetical protein ABI432_00915 [Flavobacteriales bacterium]